MINMPKNSDYYDDFLNFGETNGFSNFDRLFKGMHTSEVTCSKCKYVDNGLILPNKFLALSIDIRTHGSVKKSIENLDD